MVRYGPSFLRAEVEPVAQHELKAIGQFSLDACVEEKAILPARRRRGRNRNNKRAPSHGKLEVVLDIELRVGIGCKRLLRRALWDAIKVAFLSKCRASYCGENEHRK